MNFTPTVEVYASSVKSKVRLVIIPNILSMGVEYRRQVSVVTTVVIWNDRFFRV